MAAQERVEQGPDGWYLRCGTERRGPFRTRPVRTSSAQASASVNTGGAQAATQATHETETWQTEAGQIQIRRTATLRSDGTMEVQEGFPD